IKEFNSFARNLSELDINVAIGFATIIATIAIFIKKEKLFQETNEIKEILIMIVCFILSNLALYITTYTTVHLLTYCMYFIVNILLFSLGINFLPLIFSLIE
ncbi:hypothetical protein, partial [Bacillus smithii]|uniref:hypothetical protein n=1 Tax=Bacillus smithii TaxID=1479 RepID=UPI0030CA0115